jgi:putative hemolysin
VLIATSSVEVLRRPLESALCHLVSLVRDDFNVVAMSTLCRVPEVRDYVLPINFADTPEAAATSARSRREARTLLKIGGCLIIFPGGAVSTSRAPFGPAVDDVWHPFAGRLIMGSHAAVLPVHFEGQNSRLFQLVSRVSMTLRISLLVRETLRRIGSDVSTCASATSHRSLHWATRPIRRRWLPTCGR